MNLQNRLMTTLFLTGRAGMLASIVAKEDYVGWANGLRRAGYVTDPKYGLLYRALQFGAV
jgi:hypothetical protein